MDGISGNLEIPDSSRERVLFLLKTKRPMTAATLARRLAVTSMAVHQHLASLREEGLVDFTKERRRVGRPAHLWRLTPKGHDRFPDSHAEFAVGMMKAIMGAFGEEGLARLTEERTRQQLASYREQMPGLNAPMEVRVAALARIRRDEGFMPEWGRGCDGAIELVENHCSMARAARFCPGLCEGELSLFRAVLGDDLSINRVEHVLAGDSRCTYRITEQPAEVPGPVSAERAPKLSVVNETMDPLPTAEEKKASLV